MTIGELYIFFQPLINFLGTICLIALAAGGTLYAIIWVIRRVWKYILAFGVLTAVVVSLALVMGVA